MTLKEEFVEDVRKELGYTPGEGEFFGAKWMADYIENKAKHWPNDDIICNEIRQLAKELE